MWKGVGRSGIGDQTIIGEYDDFDGLSMNGRQWKNPLTKETRDLSGADYWHMRKAIEPKSFEDIPTFVNGRPNIQAFSEDGIKQWLSSDNQQQANSRPASVYIHPYCVMPGEEEIEALDEQQLMLYKQYKAGRLSCDRYNEMVTPLRERQQKAWDEYIKRQTKR